MRCKVTTHHIPAPPDCHHLDSDEVQAMLFVRLHHKAQKIFVEEFHTPVVAAPSALRNDTKSCGIPCLNFFSDLGLLQEYQVNVCLVNTAQRQLNAAMSYDLDVVGTKTDNLHFFMNPLPSPVSPS